MIKLQMLGLLEESGFEQENRVFWGGCPTLRANNARVNVLTRQNSVEVIGQMDNTIDHTFESANRVYSRYGVCPTIPTCAGGGFNQRL